MCRYPHLIEDELDSLVANRQVCSIKTNNQFLFDNTVLNNIRGCDVLRELVEKCHLTYVLQKPHLIRSIKLCKHVAKIASILVLNGEELGHLSNHLGHSEAVHRGFYRQQESVIEKKHITKILELANTGNIAKYSVAVCSASSCQFAFCVNNNKRAVLARFTNILIFSLQPELEGRFCSLHVAWNKSHSPMLQLSFKCYSFLKKIQIEEYVQK